MKVKGALGVYLRQFILHHRPTEYTYIDLTKTPLEILLQTAMIIERVENHKKAMTEEDIK